MSFLCRPNAERLLAESDFSRLWLMFTNMGVADATREGGGWLTAELRDQYRAVWGGRLGPGAAITTVRRHCARRRHKTHR